MLFRLALATIVFIVPVATRAAETTTYKYDAKGRLVEVKQTGGPANNASSTYQYDAADNRTNVKVDAQRRVVVVPLNGFTVIPLN
ncbi:YD repeat-containing protein [Sphingobium sp. B1D7B]|uniref:RHS repeat domain-containing protein n=1 Tax=Sphingobium sp. B1D7B TaxID=2940578 RepID=UPI0022251190|nr:RHS repeat domain-containing protein [Sphingobium sp. B1D7B]MCW2404394.1 YD repeat-containing protein [Sphingobium sp. B1D7B]